jgi:hypothetical protein
MEDLIGKKFGRLTPTKYLGTNKWRNGKWLCLCSCGNQKECSSSNLRSGGSKSCGCLQKERTILANTIHGQGRTRIYRIWTNMLERCNNPNNPFYKDYGGRGIIVCKRWLKFENFLKDVGNPPEGLTFDRTNNDKGYFPDNWKWSTPKEQANNRRDNINK